jgi:hypothetical protein
MSHLYGAILKPSHTDRFTDWWTSSLQDTLVSHSLQQASGSEPKTLGTSGRTSQEQLELFALDSVSLKMSKDTSALDSAKSLESWKALVTRRRGEYSARLKSGRLTSASGSSSWPSTIASEVRQGFQDRSRGMKGSQESLTTVVVKESANWPTPDASNHRDGAVLRTDNNLEQGGFHGVSLHHAMTKYGQAAPESSNTHGSRQGLWLTPRANEPDNDPNFAARNADRGAHCHGTLSSQAKQLWPTITAHTPDMESNGPNGHSGTYLAGAVKQWATPQASGTSTRPNKTTPRQGLTLIEQARANEWRTPTVAEEKNQGTSSQIYLQNQVGAVQKQWATPIQGDSHLASTPEVAQKRIEEGKVTLSRQNPGKLNPRWVETLMGLPVGWTMPSCKSPVIIELTNCASSATESCQQQQSEHSELFVRNSQND